MANNTENTENKFKKIGDHISLMLCQDTEFVDGIMQSGILDKQNYYFRQFEITSENKNIVLFLLPFNGYYFINVFGYNLIKNNIKFQQSTHFSKCKGIIGNHYIFERLDFHEILEHVDFSNNLHIEVKFVGIPPIENNENFKNVQFQF